MPDANTAGVVPPEGAKDRSYHFLDLPNGEWVIAQWYGFEEQPEWFFCGREIGQAPTELADDGWTYVGPVQPPATEGGDG